MKGLLCCAILLLVCVLVQVQGNCEYNDEILPVGLSHRECLKITCYEDGTMSMLACPLVHCRPDQQQIGHRELDISKPYPECCARPICKTN